VFEGVTRIKGYVDDWNREKPVFPVDADPTNFHVMDEP
jgi:hypothetical protein